MWEEVKGPSTKQEGRFNILTGAYIPLVVMERRPWAFRDLRLRRLRPQGEERC